MQNEFILTLNAPSDVERTQQVAFASGGVDVRTSSITKALETVKWRRIKPLKKRPITLSK